MNCQNPKCATKPTLVHISHNDSLTHKHYVCPACSASYQVPTRFDPIVKAALPMTTVVAVVSNWDKLVDFVDAVADAV